MNWQKTVLSEKRLKDKLGDSIILGQQARNALEYQAKITGDIAYKAGIMKVVEFAEKFLSLAKHGDYSDNDELLDSYKEKWETFRKDNGIDHVFKV